MLMLLLLQRDSCRRKSAIYWAQAEPNLGLFLVLGHRAEMNQRTVSHSATLRSPSLVMFPCCTLLCSNYGTFPFNLIKLNFSEYNVLTVGF